MSGQRYYSRREIFLLGTIGPVCMVIVWELVSRLKVMNPMLISSPTLVAEALVEWAASGHLWRDLLTSLMETVIGFGAAVILGIGVGVLIGLKKYAEYAIDPFLWVIYAIPLVSLWPLFIMWLGFGYQPIIAMAFLFAVVQIIINSYTGIKCIEPVLMRCAASFNASSMDRLFKFTLPAALPMILAGVRLGIGRALIGVVIGELFSSNAGLGFHISYFGSRLNFSQVFAGLFVVVILGLFTTQLIRVIEMRLQSWKG